MKFRLSILFPIFVLLASCSREQSPSASTMLGSWQQLCVDVGPTHENATAIANTFSLKLWTADDIAASKSHSLAQQAVINGVLKEHYLSLQTFVRELEGWWFDGDKQAALIYSSVFETQSNLVSGSSSSVARMTCVVRGPASSFAEIQDALTKIGKDATTRYSDARFSSMNDGAGFTATYQGTAGVLSMTIEKAAKYREEWDAIEQHSGKQSPPASNRPDVHNLTDLAN